MGLVLVGTLRAPYPDDPSEMGVVEWVQARTAMRSAASRIEALESGIHACLEGQYERPVGKVWRKDLEPSKHDQCVHGLWMYEECDACLYDHFEDVLLGLKNEGTPK